MNKKLNYDFKLKDYEATKARHIVQIRKVRTQANWDKIIDSNWMEEIEGMIKNGLRSTWWEYNIVKEDGRLHDYRNHQSKLREVKTAINGTTRQFIKAQLKWYGLPESWDTAFYILYYKRINAGMKRLAKYYL